MKRHTITAILAASAVSLWASAEITWLTQKHDFGAFDEEMGTVSCTFKGVNTGDEPVVILDARANCGCTTPSYSNSPTAPGDTISVTVGYNASGRPGKFNKQVIVTTNTTPAKTNLYITGSVIGSEKTLHGRYPIDGGIMKLRSDKLPFGAIDKNSVGSQYIECVNASHDTIHPTVSGLPPYISATVSPASVSPGETFIISALFDSAKCNDWDVVTDSFTICAGNDSVNINTAAIIKEHFNPDMTDAPAINITPATLDAGRIDTTQPGKLTLELTISNSGTSPLVIRKISSTDTAIKISVKNTDIKPGKKTKAQITVDRTALVGRAMLNALIIIVANDPVKPRTAVRLTGEIPSQP